MIPRRRRLGRGQFTSKKASFQTDQMTIGSFIVKNALRNKRRATLSILSVAVSLFLLVTLLVALRELTVPPEGEGAALRVVVRSKISIANALPARQRPIIERIPGVEAISPFTWFGGKFKSEEAMSFAQFAVDPVEFPRIFVESKVPPEQVKAFQADRQGSDRSRKKPWHQKRNKATSGACISTPNPA